MTVSGLITATVIGAIIGAMGCSLALGKQNISVLVGIVIGIVAALLETVLAITLSSADTAGHVS